MFLNLIAISCFVSNVLAQQRNNDSIIDNLTKRVEALEAKVINILPVEKSILLTREDSLKQLMVNYYHAKSFDEKLTYVTEPQKFKQVLIDYSSEFNSSSKYTLMDFEVLNSNTILNKYNKEIFYISNIGSLQKIDILRSIGYNENSFVDFKNSNEKTKGIFKVRLTGNTLKENRDDNELADILLTIYYPYISETVSFKKSQIPKLYDLLKSGKDLKVELELEIQNGKYRKIIVITKLMSATW